MLRVDIQVGQALYHFPDLTAKKHKNDKKKSKACADVFGRCDVNYFDAIMSLCPGLPFY